MKLKLYPYQKNTVIETEDFNGRALLALEMGLGKTVCALTYALKNKKTPCLVVCPASVKYNWEHEARHYFGVPSRVLEGRTPPSSVNGLLKMEKIVVINYDILKFWIPYLIKCRFQTVVFDECHFLANRSAQRTKAAQLLARGLPHCLALSGTPLTNRPAELFTTLNMLCPDEFPSFWRFARMYCNPKLSRWGWDYSGASNLQALHNRLTKNCMIRYRKKDVLLDLPDKVRRVIPIELDDIAQYYKARDNFLGWIKENHPRRLSKVFKATALARTGDLLRLAARLKLKGVVGWCNRFLEETDEKLIIFAVHKKCIQVLQRRIGAKSVTVDGSVTGRKRQDAVDQFQNDPKVRVFIGNIKAAGVGINLTEASTVVFAELWWKPGDHTQAEDRVHRIGQKQQPWIYYFIGADTIEESLCQIIQKKQEVITATLDGKSNGVDVNVYDLLMKELQKGKK